MNNQMATDSLSPDTETRRITLVKNWYRLGWLLPWVVLLASLAVTYLMWRSEQQNAMKDLQLDFDFRVRETQARMSERIKAYEQILRGAKSLFLASDSVEPQAFRTYVESLHLDDNYPGSHGIGFVDVVSPSNKARHEKEMRAAGFSNYRIKPEGNREIYTPVVLIEPFFGNNRLTIGRDFYADPVSRAAMELSRDSNKVVNSGQLILPPEDSEDARNLSGFLMFEPFFKSGSPIETIEERRSNIAGWVYAPFHMMDLMTGILGEIATEIDIEIHDGEKISDETMMYDPDVSGAGGNPHALFKNISQIKVGQHVWSVVIVSLPGFEAQLDRGKSGWVAYVGIMMGLMLTILAWLLVQGRARALQAAEAINHELTERKRAEEGLLLADTVVKTVEEGVVVTDRENRIVAINPAFTVITGYTAEEVRGRNPRILSSGKHTKEFYREMWTTLLATGSWRGEIFDRRKNGEIYIEGLSIKLVRNEEGEITHHVGTFSDVSERKAAEERIQYLAHHDVLTNLPNRALFSDRLQQSLSLSKRDKNKLALMFLDLDKFKPINDNYGHAVGDQLLKEVAQRLQNCVRESDTVSRIGGDEFVVLLPVIEAEQDAVLVADKILHSLNQPFEIAGKVLHVSVSIGFVVYPDHGTDEITLTKNADLAMYYAKASGRDNAKLFQSDMLDKGAHCDMP